MTKTTTTAASKVQALLDNAATEYEAEQGRMAQLVDGMQQTANWKNATAWIDASVKRDFAKTAEVMLASALNPDKTYGMLDAVESMDSAVDGAVNDGFGVSSSDVYNAIARARGKHCYDRWHGPVGVRNNWLSLGRQLEAESGSAA